MAITTGLESQYQQLADENNDFENPETILDWDSILYPPALETRTTPSDLSIPPFLPTTAPAIPNPILDPTWNYTLPLRNPFDIFAPPHTSTAVSTPADSPFANWLSTDLALPQSDDGYPFPGDSLPLFPSSLATPSALVGSIAIDGEAGVSGSSRGNSRSRSKVANSPLAGEYDDGNKREGSAGDEKDKRRRNTEASARFRAKKKAKNGQLESSTFELRNSVEKLEIVRDSLLKENKLLKSILSSAAR